MSRSQYKASLIMRAGTSSGGCDASGSRTGRGLARASTSSTATGSRSTRSVGTLASPQGGRPLGSGHLNGESHASVVREKPFDAPGVSRPHLLSRCGDGRRGPRACQRSPKTGGRCEITIPVHIDPPCRKRAEYAARAPRSAISGEPPASQQCADGIHRRPRIEEAPFERLPVDEPDTLGTAATRHQGQERERANGQCAGSALRSILISLGGVGRAQRILTIVRWREAQTGVEIVPRPSFQQSLVQLLFLLYPPGSCACFREKSYCLRRASGTTRRRSYAHHHLGLRPPAQLSIHHPHGSLLPRWRERPPDRARRAS